MRPGRPTTDRSLPSPRRRRCRGRSPRPMPGCGARIAGSRRPDARPRRQPAPAGADLGAVRQPAGRLPYRGRLGGTVEGAVRLVAVEPGRLREEFAGPWRGGAVAGAAAPARRSPAGRAAVKARCASRAVQRPRGLLLAGRPGRRRGPPSGPALLRRHAAAVGRTQGGRECGRVVRGAVHGARPHRPRRAPGRGGRAGPGAGPRSVSSPPSWRPARVHRARAAARDGAEDRCHRPDGRAGHPVRRTTCSRSASWG